MNSAKEWNRNKNNDMSLIRLDTALNQESIGEGVDNVEYNN